MDLQPDSDKPDRLLVVFQCDIAVFSVPLVFRSKAQPAGNGHSLGKGCNVVAGHQGSALRVSLSAPMDFVAPLGKGMAIPCETRLAMYADKLTEYDNITLKDH